jgi:hypothetical protein
VTCGQTARFRGQSGKCLSRVERLLLWASGERDTFHRHVANLTGGIALMAIHLTPTELAREAGLERRDVIEKCMQMGVPIFQGRIDKTLFMANLTEYAPREDARSPLAAT